MGKKGKIKVSKVKRNNQTTNKMKKQGKLKLQRHRNKVQKQKVPEKPKIEYSESESESGEEWRDMLDEDEQQYIMSRLSKQPQLLANVPEEEKPEKSTRKRKKPDKGKAKSVKADNMSGADSDSSVSDLEEKYEKEQSERPVKKTRPLLPIKTKAGLEEREEECEESESEDDQTEPPPTKKKKDDDKESIASASDIEMETSDVEDDGEGEEREGVVSSVQILAARRDRLAHDKLRIGALCSSLLETPERKLKNLYPILYLMDERLKDNTLNLNSVRKLATLSACEVFKDILPDYMIRHQDYTNVKLKKDTLSLYKYEKELLEFYKRYLQRLEKGASALRRKKGDTRKLEDSMISYALICLKCMCSMLSSKSNFNYATNIAQSVVPFLACKEERARSIVTQCCVQVFQEDSKGEIMLAIVRLINQLVKRRGERLEPSALDCLLSLRISGVDMDADNEIQHKKKQGEKHKKRLINLSKKEKKRAKKLKEVERELLETQAQESEAARRKQLTEVTKTVFHIYFRLLKTAPGSALLTAALNGIAKFSHVINMEYYCDLVAILQRLLESDSVPVRQKMCVVRAVLAVLSGAGDALTLDPAVFHSHLYSNALNVHAGRTDTDARVVVECVRELCARARRVPTAVLAAFAKRLATLALQLHHNGALACIALLHQLVQSNNAVASMLTWEAESAAGRFNPLLPAPEQSNAATGTALFELPALTRHHHPAVRTAAQDLMHSRPLLNLTKLSPVQIFDEYDGSQLAFKPPVPPPKKSEFTSKAKPRHIWTQPSFKELCETIEANVDMKFNVNR